jgi:hypothetical protein
LPEEPEETSKNPKVRSDADMSIGISTLGAYAAARAQYTKDFFTGTF